MLRVARAGLFGVGLLVLGGIQTAWAVSDGPVLAGPGISGPKTLNTYIELANQALSESKTHYRSDPQRSAQILDAAIGHISGSSLDSATKNEINGRLLAARKHCQTGITGQVEQTSHWPNCCCPQDRVLHCPHAPSATAAAPSMSEPGGSGTSDLPSVGDLESGALGTGSSTVASSPAMIGDLLGGTRGITYFLHRVGDQFADVENGGFINFRNTKIAENNSPLPRGRVSFRYNYFHNALDIGGYSTENPIIIQQGGIIPPNQGLPGAGGPFPDLVRFRTVQKSYDVDLFTFGVEQTFLDGLASVELRVPFSNTLASNLSIDSGDFNFVGNNLNIDPTPEGTLGNDDVEFGNMSLILKGILHRQCNTVFTAGLGVGMPTGKDTSVTVTDFIGPTTAVFPGLQAVDPRLRFIPDDADTVRVRRFDIDNETWSLSPFLAALITPDASTFLHGFAQVEIPLNQATVEYERVTQGGFVFQPQRARHELQEQTLLHLDVGGGYWLCRDPHSLLSGIAALLELHYTSTLNDADTITLPGEDPNNFIRQTESFLQNGFVDEPAPEAGNQANRLDILNVTAGLTFELCNTATITPAVVLPLRDDDDKLFDWEFNLQVNLYR